MIIGPRYKRARKLGVAIYEKTQTPKYVAHLAKKQKLRQGRGGKTDYALQLLEKQKARHFYGINERQFGNYVAKALISKTDTSTELIKMLESRLDNVVLKMSLLPSRASARQSVTHGHITVNGKTVNIPSYQVSIGDVIAIRDGSKNKKNFIEVWEKVKKIGVPAWIKCDIDKQCAMIDGLPRVAPTDLLFNVKSVLEFYTR